MGNENLYINGRVGGSSKKLQARFYWDAIPDKQATLEAGRPIFKDAPHVLLISDHGRRQIPKLSTPEIIKNYQAEYDSFINRVELTPLIMIDLKPYQVKELEHFGIKSVEDFSKVECPKGFEAFGKIANLLNQHRERNEQANNTIQNNKYFHESGPDVRGTQIQQTQNTDSSSRNTKENNQKENSQEVTPLFNFTYQL